MNRTPAPDLIALSIGQQRLLSVLRAAGATAFVVGGGVRDALMGRDPHDLDLEVFGRSLEELDTALTRGGFDVIEVGRSFGILKVRVDGDEVDVAVPRREHKDGTGHKGFTIETDPGLTIRAATARRDFTVNALLWDPLTHELVDEWNGLADLRAGVLRHVSPAFVEDPLRVLRAAQFAARFDMSLHPDTAAFCRDLRDEHEHLPVERIQAEWMKIAGKAAKPSRAIEVLRETGWISFLPELAALDDIPQDPRWHPEGTVDVHVGLVADAAAAIAERDRLDDTDRAILVFGALCHDLGKATHTQIHDDGRITAHGHAAAGVTPTRTLLTSLGMPGNLVAQITPLVAEHMCAVTTDEPSTSAVRRLARRLGPSSIEMWARVVTADHRGRGTATSEGPAGRWVALAVEIAVDNRPAAPLVTGDMLIKMGLQPGPQFRPILDAAMDAQDAGLIVDGATAEVWAAGEVRAASTGSTMT